MKGSIPHKSVDGSGAYVADEAAFTPRNVQAVESRSATVHRVEISIAYPGHALKPGMPANATLHIEK